MQRGTGDSVPGRSYFANLARRSRDEGPTLLPPRVPMRGLQGLWPADAAAEAPAHAVEAPPPGPSRQEVPRQAGVQAAQRPIDAGDEATVPNGVPPALPLQRTEVRNPLGSAPDLPGEAPVSSGSAIPAPANAPAGRATAQAPYVAPDVSRAASPRQDGSDASVASTIGFDGGPAGSDKPAVFGKSLSQASDSGPATMAPVGAARTTRPAGPMEMPSPARLPERNTEPTDKPHRDDQPDRLVRPEPRPPVSLGTPMQEPSGQVRRAAPPVMAPAAAARADDAGAAALRPVPAPPGSQHAAPNRSVGREQPVPSAPPSAAEALHAAFKWVSQPSPAAPPLLRDAPMADGDAADVRVVEEAAPALPPMPVRAAPVASEPPMRPTPAAAVSHHPADPAKPRVLHIGTIEVNIQPLPGPRPITERAVRQAPPAGQPANLSRGFTTSLGLRQG